MLKTAETRSAVQRWLCLASSGYADLAKAPNTRWCKAPGIAALPAAIVEQTDHRPRRRPPHKVRTEKAARRRRPKGGTKT